MPLRLWRPRGALKGRLKALEDEGMALREVNPEAALEKFREVLKHRPHRIRSLRAAGRQLMKLRRADEAAPVWRALARLAPSQAEPHIQLARIHRRNRHQAEALAEVRQALALEPNNSAANDLCWRIEATWRETFDSLPPAPAAPQEKGLVRRMLASLRREPSASSHRRRTIAETLKVRARNLAVQGDDRELIRTLEQLLATKGPSGDLLDLVHEHRPLIEASGSAGLKAVLADRGARAEAGASADATQSLKRRIGVRARAGDGAAVATLLEGLLAIDGPTDDVVSLVRTHAEFAAVANSRPLKAMLPEPGSSPPFPEYEALQDEIRRQAKAKDNSGVSRLLERVLMVEGPSDRAIALIRAHRTAVLASGSPRLAHALKRPRGQPPRRSAGRKPRERRVVETLREHFRGNDLQGAVGVLSALADRTDDEARRALEDVAVEVVDAFTAQVSSLGGDDRQALERQLARIYQHEAWVIQALARQREHEGDDERALALLVAVSDAAEGAGAALLQAVRIAARTHRPEAEALALRATALADGDRRIVSACAEALEQAGEQAAALSVWRAASGSEQPPLWIRRGLVRTLEAVGETGELVDRVRELLRQRQPLDELPAAEQNYIIEMVRHLGQAIANAAPETLQACEEDVTAAQPPSALRGWILATLALARPDRTTALIRLGDAIGCPPVTPGVALDLHAERALLFQRYHLFGEALEVFTAASEMALSARHYRRRLAMLQSVQALCTDAPAPLRYPECLIDVILAEAAQRMATYTPIPRCVAMVSGSLGQGGGERQTLTVVRKMLPDPRVSSLCLFVRSTHLRPSDDFFLSQVEKLPVDLTIYGKDWAGRSNLAELLPELADSPRLMSALELLPHNAREEIARLTRLILDKRPQAVHIWQDIPNAALACVLAGAPRFFIHRGSLAPDYWEQNELQTETHFRPMRHVYRRLLERPDFVLLNNSISGCRTDQEWLEWPDPQPFQVVYNAVDFAQLGDDTGRNLSLRRELSIPDEAPVIGGSFRIAAVKRPLYWIEAARQAREAVPGAQFLIIGDGDMMDDVARFAQEHGMSEIVHLPGRVANVGDWYRAMDIMLMTSEREGIPNAIIEAQHFSAAIIATRVGGIHEAIEEGVTGLLAPPDEGPDAYARTLIQALTDEAWLQNARRRAPDFVHEKFSLEHVVDQLMGYYGIERAPAV